MVLIISHKSRKKKRFRFRDNDVRNRKKPSVKYRSNNNWRCMRWLLNRAIWLNSDRKWVNYILWPGPRQSQSQSCARMWLLVSGAMRCDVCIEYWMRWWWDEDHNVIKNEPVSLLSPISKMWERTAAEKKWKEKRNVNYIGVSHFSRTMHCPLHAPSPHSGRWSTGLRAKINYIT